MKDTNSLNRDRAKKNYFPEFHRLFKGLIVEVCEGLGTPEDVKRLVYYVHDKKGNLLGRLDTYEKI